MKANKKSYYSPKWNNFSEKIKQRDDYKCLRCGRKEPEVVLQVHHLLYRSGLELWEYPQSDCITLCKGCHANEHGLVEPDIGWILISIEDLGGPYGTCERKGCGNEIRYEHVTYHPQWGYKTVGSTCVEHLTREDQFLSQEVLKIFKKVSEFISNSEWEIGITKKGNEYLSTTHSHHQIRIYGRENDYSFQIVIKNKGEKWIFKKIEQAKNRNLIQVKELAYIVLKGITTENEKVKEILRNIYRRI